MKTLNRNDDNKTDEFYIDLKMKAMNDVYGLLHELKKHGAKIYSEEGKIKLDIEKEYLTNEISEKIKYFRNDILALIGEKSQKLDLSPVEKVVTQKSYPLSDTQKRLWMLSRSQEEFEAYTITGNIYLNSATKIDCFKKAVESVVDRHEILRTTFKSDETGEIKQWVLGKEELNFQISHKDYRNQKDKQTSIQSFLKAEASKYFNLKNASLFRAGLLQIEDEDYVFYFSIHHMISDGWSISVLHRDIQLCYKTYVENRKLELQPLRIQYKDYSAWLKEQLKGETYEAHRKYWLESLNGHLPILNLPSNKQRPLIKTYNGVLLNTTYIGYRTVTKLKKYSNENGGNLFIGLLAAWNVLMYRYTAQTDIIIGTRKSGREHIDLKDQIGPYANFLALRNKIEPNDDFNTFFSRVMQTTLNAHMHQMYPYSKLLEELSFISDENRRTVFDCLFVFPSNEGKEEFRESKRKAFNQVEDIEFNKVLFDIELEFNMTEDYLSLQVMFNPDIYDLHMVEGLIRHYKQLLNALLENPTEKISDIDYLSNEEKSETLMVLNESGTAYLNSKTIIDLFEEQVNVIPDNIAVVFKDTMFTYGALDKISNRLANYLRKKYDIKTEDLIIIKQERSEWLIVSMLAILKAGGAYVAIDPVSTKEQIAYMQKDANCEICLDEEELAKFRAEQFKYSDGKLECKVEQSNLACVIYTADVSGRGLKGVMVEHGNVVRLFDEKSPFNFTNKDVWAMSHSYGLDLSLWEIYGSMLNGCKLIILSREVSEDPALYLELIDKKGITILNHPPFGFYGLSKEMDPVFHRLGLRYIIFGGEDLEQGQLEFWAGKCPSSKLINMYGFPETSTHITYKEITEVTTHNSKNIGKILPTVTCMVLDERRNLLPLGIAGELYIGGKAITRGYLHREHLTSERFINHPFIKGEKLYRTGDRMKQLNNKEFQYLGRMDEQLKPQGYNLNLEEVEDSYNMINYPVSVKQEKTRMIKLNTFSKDNEYIIMAPPFQGQSIYFKDFSSFIKDKYNCYGIDYSIEHDFESILEISNLYATVIAKEFTDQTIKLNIMGFSMGAPIAFEIGKTLEKMNYSCEIFLIDYVPRKQLPLKATNIDYQDLLFEEQVKIALNIFPESNFPNIKRSIAKKFQIINHHTITGKIKSNIYCLEGLTIKSSSMQLWEKFTLGQFGLEKIESLHDEIFSKENYNKLYYFIQKRETIKPTN